MSTITTTTTITREASAVLKLERHAQIKIDTPLERLVNLYHHFQNMWTDPTSVQIKEWIVEVLMLNENSEYEFDPNFIKNRKAYLDVLINQIVVDRFFTQHPTIYPILVKETEWTCEQLFFEACNITNNGSPYTIIPHEFALAIRQWALDWEAPTTKEIAVGQNLDLEAFKTSLLGRMTLRAYPSLVKQALIQEQVADLTAHSQHATQSLERLRGIMQQQQDLLDQELEQRAEERRELLKNRMDEIEKRHQKNIAHLESQLHGQEAKLKTLRHEIAAKRQNTDEQDLAIQNLKEEITKERQRIQCLQEMMFNQKRKKFLGIF